jgi:hypothetical protein
MERHTAAVEILLVGLALLVVVGLPLAVAVVPPVAMASMHRWPPSAVALWVLGLGLLAAWTVAGATDIDRADATGGTGSLWAGLGWLIGSAVAAAGSVATVRRHYRHPASPGG